MLDDPSNGHALYHAMRHNIQPTYQVGGVGADAAAAVAPETPPQHYQPETLVKKCSQTLTKGLDGNYVAPNFSTDAPKCDKNWQPYNPKKMPPNSENVYIQRPTRGKNINKKRFLIFVAGPPGSGKSTIALSMQRNATAINPEAAGFKSKKGYSFIQQISSAEFKENGWVTLGHDQEICEDPRYHELCSQLRKNKPSNLTKPSISDFLNPSSPWAKKMREDQHAYNKIRYGNTQKSITSIDKRLAAKEFIDSIQKANPDEDTNEAIHSVKDHMLHAIHRWYGEDAVDGGGDDTQISVKQAARIWADKKGYTGTDIILYIKLLYMIQNGVNIVYETTFQKYEMLQYTFEQVASLTNNCETYQYIIMLGFPIVNILTLQHRILNRYIKGCSEDETCEYRGLQGIDFTSLACQMHLSYENLIAYIETCGHSKSACNGVGIDLLYIFNNNMNNKPEELWNAIRLNERSYSIRGQQHKNKGVEPNNPTIKDIIDQLNANLKCIPLAYRGQISHVHSDNVSPKALSADEWINVKAQRKEEEDMIQCSLSMQLPSPDTYTKTFSQDLYENSQTGDQFEEDKGQEDEHTLKGGHSKLLKTTSRRRRTRRHKRKGKKGRRRTRRQGSS